MMRCPACGHSWLARHLASDVYGFRTRTDSAARPALIIEGEVLASAKRGRAPRLAFAGPGPAAAQAAHTARQRVGRYGFAAGAAALVFGLIAVILLAPAVSALPTASEPSDGAGITVPTDAFLVEGEIINGSDREVDVPALRATEVYAWQVEPARLRLAADATGGFPAAVAHPVPGPDDIAAAARETEAH